MEMGLAPGIGPAAPNTNKPRQASACFCGPRGTHTSAFQLDDKYVPNTKAKKLHDREFEKIMKSLDEFELDAFQPKKR
jgi:hypothetical protein